MYQLRGQDQFGNDTGELRYVDQMQQAMEMFLDTNDWWKLSFNLPNGKRIRLVKVANDVINVTYPNEMCEEVIASLSEK
jgi:hypothetical protein